MRALCGRRERAGFPPGVSADRLMAGLLPLMRRMAGPGPHTRKDVAEWCGLPVRVVLEVELAAMGHFRERFREVREELR